MMITVIINTYKRQYALAKQLEAIQNQTIMPTEIIIVHNDDITIPFSTKIDSNIKLIRSSYNYKYHLRFAVGLLATHYVAQKQGLTPSQRQLIF